MTTCRCNVIEQPGRRVCRQQENGVNTKTQKPEPRSYTEVVVMCIYIWYGCIYMIILSRKIQQNKAAILTVICDTKYEQQLRNTPRTLHSVYVHLRNYRVYQNQAQNVIFALFYFSFVVSKIAPAPTCAHL